MSDILTKIVAHIVMCIYVFVIFGVPAALVSYFDFFGAASRSFVEIFIAAAFTISTANMIRILFERGCEHMLAYCRRRKAGAA